MGIDQKWLLIVNRGLGNGKTRAELGLAFRELGHDYKVSVIQLIKVSACKTRPTFEILNSLLTGLRACQ